MRSKRENTYGVPARSLTDAHHGRTTHSGRTQDVQNQDAPRQPQAILP